MKTFLLGAITGAVLLALGVMLYLRLGRLMFSSCKRIERPGVDGDRVLVRDPLGFDERRRLTPDAESPAASHRASRRSQLKNGQIESEVIPKTAL